MPAVSIRAILAVMHKAIRAAVLSIVPMLLIMANPWTGAHAERSDTSIRTAVASAGGRQTAASAIGYAYTVQPADTLWDIAAAHGITVRALIAANRLVDPGLLRPGQVLWVPAAPPLSATRSAQAASSADGEAAAGAAGATLTQTSPPADPDAQALPTEQEQWPSELLSLINESRIAAGLPPLTWSPELARAAQAHAEDCARRNQGSHVGSDGAPLVTRIGREGSAARWASENWANAQSVQHAFALWWNEAPGRDPHRRNILNPRYTEIGIGVATAQWGTYFIVDFAGR